MSRPPRGKFHRLMDAWGGNPAYEQPLLKRNEEQMSDKTYALRYELDVEFSGSPSGDFTRDDPANHGRGLADALIVVSIVRGPDGSISTALIPVAGNEGKTMSRRDLLFALQLARDTALMSD